MEITACKINPVENQGRVKAYCTVTVENAIVIHGIRIREGQNGLYVDFPQRQNKNGEYDAIVKPVSKEAYQQFAAYVLARYEQVLQSPEQNQGNRTTETDASYANGYANDGYRNNGYQAAGSQENGYPDHQRASAGGYNSGSGYHGR